MVEMKCSQNRDELSRITYKSGVFEYELIADFAKNLPDHDFYASIAGGFCDKDDNLVLIARGVQNPFIVLDRDGNWLEEYGKGMIVMPHFAIGTDCGTTIATDMAKHVVREFDKEGNILLEMGNYGIPSDSGYNPKYYQEQRRLGNYYPPEPYMRIPGLTAGTEAERFTTVRMAEPFNTPDDVAMDSKGNIYVADGNGNVAVQKFDRKGRHLKTWGGRGDEPGRFVIVHAIEVDSKDQIWVCDRDQNAIHVFDSEGNILAYCKGNLGQPSGIVADKDFIYCVGRGGYLTIFTPEFEIVAQFGYFNSELRAHDIAVNSNGDLFLFPTTATEDHQCICLKRVK